MIIDGNDYNNHPGVNKSTLWEMRKSPLHYWHLMHDTPREDTKALKFGRAVHSRILTPDAFEAEYITAPLCDRRTKEGKAIWAELMESGKEIISAEDMEAISAMQREYMRTVPDIMSDPTLRTEVPLFWTDNETGVPCKGRLDAITSSMIYDYKTANDASTDTFRREALRYGYDMQAAMYLEAARANGYDPEGFVFIVQEKTAPYLINVIRAGEAFIDRGTWIMRELLAKYKECRDTDYWPGYGTNELIISEWEAITDE